MSRLAPTDDAWVREHFRKQDALPQGYGAKRDDDKMVTAVVLFPEKETDLNIYVSIDGSDAKVVNLPNPKRNATVTICHRAGERFALVVTPVWIGKSRRFGDQAMVPQLSDGVEWTDAERAEWRSMLPAFRHLFHSLASKAVKQARRYHSARYAARARW